MDKFVHLCFVTGHPMAFRVKERKPDAELIYLQIDRAIRHQPDIMFATGVGYANNAEMVTLAEAVERNLIDFRALYAWTDWRDPETQAKRRAAELCEILVPNSDRRSHCRQLDLQRASVRVLPRGASLRIAGNLNHDPCRTVAF